MKLHTAFLLLLLTAFNFLSAQKESENFKISGAVADLFTNKPLVGASVIIISKSSGTQLKGTKADEKGNFEIDKIPESKVRVKFSMIGYQTQIIDSVALDQSSRLGLIKLMPTTIELTEIVVKSVKPMIEFHADKQVINMDRLPGNSGSLTDALKNSGLVEVDPATNKVSVRGQSLKIQMDGHEYPMPAEMLGQLPASMIDQVEVILAPGAKESAEGGTYILNLITKKETFSNFSGMISLSLTSNKNSFGGTYFNYKADKLNVFGQAYGSYFGNSISNTNERYVYSSPSMYYQNTAGEGKNKYYGGYFKFGFDYDFDANNSATFFVNYNGYKYKSENNGNSFVNNDNNVFEYSYNRLNNNNGTNNDLSFYGFYKKKFETKGNELTFDAMYTIYGNPTDAKMNLGYSNKINMPQLQNSNTDVNARTLILKTDYVLPIDKNKLEAGYNFTYRTRNNDYNVLDYSYRFSEWQDSLQLSNLFRYKEAINAVYASYAQKLGDFDAKFGLRAENLSTEGNQITQNINFKENFLSFFPNLNLSYKLSDMFQLGFNAFRRVTYPQIYYINPFRQYQGPNSFSAGNPKIKPNYVNSYALNLSQYISLYYTYTTGNITYATSTENDSVLISSYINLNNQDTYGFSLTLPYYNTPMMPFHLPDFISSWYVSFNYRYSKQTGQYLSEDLSLTDKSYTLNTYLGIKLPFDVDANISLYYTPKTTNRRMIRSEMKYLSIYLSKNFMDRKIRIYLIASDLLNAQGGSNETIGGSYYTRNTYKVLNSRTIGIGISYLFNDYKERRDRTIDDGRDAGNRGF
ncbi:MAG: outer membrane beta-barrel family protein [Ignavibacteriales bacterium]|nr:outer membrane beta-barrel family protein [Ignavibacteriales bacterium]